ncbi:MAG: glycosyltransferase family 4 protein [Cyclobacteriaceae bacterium]
MKILILHQHFNTPEKGGAIRSYYLAKALVDKGMEVVVITAHNEKQYKKEITEGIEVHYLPVAYDNRFGFTARSWSFLKYVKGVIGIASRFKDFNYCYAISVPLTVGLAAMWIKLRYKIPYIFEVGDLWPDAPVQMGFIKNYVFAHLLYKLERRIYQSAQSIVALSPSIQAAIESKVRDKKVHLIPNMADCEFYRPEPKQKQLVQQFGVYGKFVVSYIGAVGVANGLDYFLECANAARKAKLPIHFFICGDGALVDRLKKNAQQLSLVNLTFLDFTNRKGVQDLLNVTDAAFICYKQVPILETGSPNKFFDGLAAGKLIIINFEGWIKKELEENQCGFYSNPQQPTDFVKRIAPFLHEQELLSRYQVASRRLAEKKYSREQLSTEFAAIFS